MIEVKLSFANQAELLAFFAGTKPLVSADERAAVASITADKQEAFDPNSDKTQRIPREVIEQAKKDAAKGKPAATPAVTGAPLGALATTAAESPSEGKSAAAVTPAAPAVSSSKPDASAPAAVDYATLQKAVMALATKNKPRAKEVVESFGVATFKLLDESRWGEALAAVNAALAE